MLEEFTEDIDVTSYLDYDSEVAFGPEQKDTLLILMKHHSFSIQKAIECIYQLPSIMPDILGLMLGYLPWIPHETGGFWFRGHHQTPHQILIDRYRRNPTKVYREMRSLYYGEECLH